MSIIEYKKKIEARISNGSPKPEVEPKFLNIKDVIVVEELFQHRSGNLAASKAHIKGLVKSLRNNKGKPLDPLTVYWIGDGWSVVDGHHRLGAYKEDDYHKPVPVRIFLGSLDEAIGEALKGNAKDKLPMGIREKSNATWRLVIGTKLSINATMAASTQSRQQVCTMRKVRDSLLAKHPDIDLDDLTWWHAWRKHTDTERDEIGSEDWIESQAGILATRLSRHFGSRLGKQSNIFWRAIEIYDTRLTDDFMNALGIDPETLEMRIDEDDDVDF